MQLVQAGALVIGDRELLRLARIVQAGLPVVAARDGVLLDSDRQLAESLFRAAELISRRSKAGSGTTDDNAGAAGAPSAATEWLGTAEAATLLGTSETYVRRLARQRRLTTAGRDQRGAWRFALTEIAGLAASRTR